MVINVWFEMNDKVTLKVFLLDSQTMEEGTNHQVHFSQTY